MSIIREPLVHFLFIGLGLFALFQLVNPKSAEKEIFVSNGLVESLSAKYEKTWSRSPSQAELNNLIEAYVIEEIYYRQAKALNLDENDIMIRRRLKQQLEYMHQNMLDNYQPEDSVLQAYFTENEDHYRQDNHYSFQHVMLSTERSPTELQEKVSTLQQQIKNNSSQIKGDNSLLPAELQLATNFQIDRLFGKNFSRHFQTLPINQWSEPLTSSFGMHFIYMEKREIGEYSTFESVKSKVLQDWLNQEQIRIAKELKENLRQQYKVTIEAPINKSDPTINRALGKNS